MLDECPLSSIRIFLYTKITKDFLINHPKVWSIKNNTNLNSGTYLIRIKSEQLKTIQNYKLGFLRPFLFIFPQLHNYFSQNLGSDSHFEGLSMSES